MNTITKPKFGETLEEFSGRTGKQQAIVKTNTREERHPQDIIAQLDKRIQAFGADAGYATGWNRVFYRPFDGEKSLGGIGPINKYYLDHDALRLRSWQMLLESEIVQIGIQRYVMWLVGSGLRLRSEPDKNILAKNGINIDAQAFAKEAESYWKLYSNDEVSDNAGMETLHQKMYEAEINALAGGDCLFIINISDDNLPVCEIKDGAHIRTPLFGNFSAIGLDAVNPKTGNRIRHGIEIDAKGQHVAFFVRKAGVYGSNMEDMLSYERVPARDETTGYIRAFMYYGLRYRLDDIRGIPLISVCMETTKQMELYKEATVQGAVERAKIALVVQHELNAVGSNPFDDIVMKATGGAFSDIPSDSRGVMFQNTVAGTTGKQAVNAPPGSKIVALEGKQEIHFGEFYDTNMKVIFASLGIPMEIALMMFGSNYSASRASIKDWEHTLIVKRIKNVSPAYKHIYNIFLVTMAMQNKINAPGYLKAVFNKDLWVKLAYQRAKWIGDNPPNIDEKKEVEAARLKMGAGSAHLPLDTPENIVEDLGLPGDYRHTMEQYQDDMEYADSIGIEKVEQNRQIIEDFDDADEDKPGKPGEKGDDKAKNKRSSPKVTYTFTVR